MDVKQPCYMFFDYDGTVFVDHHIPTENLRAMQALQKEGHKLFQLDATKETPSDAFVS